MTFFAKRDTSLRGRAETDKKQFLLGNKMVLIYDAACACEQIYESKWGDIPPINGWNLVRRFKSSYDDPSTQNIDAYRAYRKEENILFVFRGTDRASDWTGNNFPILANVTPAKAQEALAFVSTTLKLQGKGLTSYITGHSLGGALAQLVGYYTDSAFVAFNPPPVRNALTGFLTMRPAGAPEPTCKSWEFDKGCVIRKDKDIAVGLLPGKFIGRDITITSDDVFYNTGNHSMKNMRLIISSGRLRIIDRTTPLSACAGRAVA